MTPTQKMHADVMSHPEMQALDKWYSDNYETAEAGKVHEMDKLYVTTYNRVELEKLKS